MGEARETPWPWRSTPGGGASRHDLKLLEPTLRALTIECPPPEEGQRYGMCLDKAYDAVSVRERLDDLGLSAHIRCRGEEARH